MKNSQKIVAALAFAGALFLNTSFDSNGHLRLISQTKAASRTKNTQPEIYACPEPGYVYTACIAGNGTCTPTICHTID